jgi:hypothetical protein
MWPASRIFADERDNVAGSEHLSDERDNVAGSKHLCK